MFQAYQKNHINNFNMNESQYPNDAHFVVSTAPHECPECGSWLVGQRISTGDEAAYNGIEDWRYCPDCDYEAFYPCFLEKSL